MAFNRYIKLMIYTVLAGILLNSIVSVFIPLYKYVSWSLISMSLFLVLAFLAYLLGQNAARVKKNGAFLSVVVINTFLKLIASFAAVFIYVHFAAPEDNLFLIPFFIYYLCFMVSETYFLTAQARGVSIQ